eukprot:TRINITY_DN1654_c0_g1_i3.p1 TRINITY_DN1654_c0_g1~~TRINITY_DN1654_c0_g1_i3.p1  ORF type:complete len:731 (+),score=185.64 TRINITY_DN1654_c0_g1_i3:1220-3412(+)
MSSQMSQDNEEIFEENVSSDSTTPPLYTTPPPHSVAQPNLNSEPNHAATKKGSAKTKTKNVTKKPRPPRSTTPPPSTEQEELAPTLKASDYTPQNELEQNIFDELIDDVILDIVFDMHRKAKTGQLDLGSVISNTPGYDIFGQSYTALSNSLSTECLNCGRQFAASRYAPHLEKCLGLGGRPSRRRAAANNDKKQNDNDEDDNNGNSNSGNHHSSNSDSNGNNSNGGNQGNNSRNNHSSNRNMEISPKKSDSKHSRKESKNEIRTIEENPEINITHKKRPFPVVKTSTSSQTPMKTTENSTTETTIQTPFYTSPSTLSPPTPQIQSIQSVPNAQPPPVATQQSVQTIHTPQNPPVQPLSHSQNIQQQPQHHQQQQQNHQSVQNVQNLSHPLSPVGQNPSYSVQMSQSPTLHSIPNPHQNPQFFQTPNPPNIQFLQQHNQTHQQQLQHQQPHQQYQQQQQQPQNYQSPPNSQNFPSPHVQAVMPNRQPNLYYINQPSGVQLSPQYPIASNPHNSPLLSSVNPNPMSLNPNPNPTHDMNKPRQNLYYAKNYTPNYQTNPPSQPVNDKQTFVSTPQPNFSTPPQTNFIDNSPKFYPTYSNVPNAANVQHFQGNGYPQYKYLTEIPLPPSPIQYNQSTHVIASPQMVPQRVDYMSDNSPVIDSSHSTPTLTPPTHFYNERVENVNQFTNQGNPNMNYTPPNNVGYSSPQTYTKSTFYPQNPPKFNLNSSYGYTT